MQNIFCRSRVWHRSRNSYLSYEYYKTVVLLPVCGSRQNFDSHGFYWGGFVAFIFVDKKWQFQVLNILKIKSN